MRLNYHGGHCCGMRQIWGLGHLPSTNHPAYEALKGRCEASGQTNTFFSGNAPLESGEKRLKRFVDFFKARQPSGICEVVLADTNCSCCHQMHWKPILEKQGFVEVSACKNSNTAHILHVFHLCIEGGKVINHTKRITDYKTPKEPETEKSLRG